MYVEKPSLISVIGAMYPDKQVSSTDPESYASIVWEVGDSVDEITLEADRLTYYRKLITNKIRDEANSERLSRYYAVLGTEDSEQIRTYEEKYTEASAYLVLNSTPTPIMNAETSHTGETVEYLAALVVAQYDAAKAALKVMYGHIEGVRRSDITTVMTYNITQLEAYNGPNWV
jgi:hypothetical protein